VGGHGGPGEVRAGVNLIDVGRFAYAPGAVGTMAAHASTWLRFGALTGGPAKAGRCPRQ
jgi:hypothetical protein